MPFSSDYQSRSQVQTPLLTALQILSRQKEAAFYAPGHKRGEGISQTLKNVFGRLVFRADLPELPELDNLFAPEGVIEEAQQLAANLFGAHHTWFLIDGSTCGIIAAILATCTTGEKMIVPRNIHRSAIAGLILSGAIPIFINPEYDPLNDLAYSITPESVEKALKQHPDTKAVMVLYPTYQGVGSDIEAIARITHQHDIPLLVDEAHGAHFAFHRDLPPSALSAGADLTVQSTHKMLGAMTQASMLHLQGQRIAPERISHALQLLQSTSPSYLLLASLDAARQQMALEGEKLMSQTLQLADRARSKLATIADLSILEPLDRSGFTYLDRTRLTVNVTQLGLTGFEADEILRQQLGVIAELPLLRHLTFIISLGNTTEDIDKLIQAFTTLSLSPSLPLSLSPHPPISLSPLSFLSPREAFFAPTITLPLEQTPNRIAAELICPYPPGIPILMPGEAIAPEAIDYLQQVLVLGGTITGCSDPTLKTLKVIR
ncbi:aminotransferase class I/II-fold pyridoxal phosphate-dependent enzyme [Pleurocapsales cyanobacterium LEGE 06147]|nr:aminotransferase class I/II-fold pyridoxal phosphate-dependent enzyme [Pleurocapsales cyanobacterium LEGE 06147]